MALQNRWQQIYWRIETKARLIFEKVHPESKVAQREKEVRFEFVNSIEEERLVSIECLACC